MSENTISEMGKRIYDRRIKLKLTQEIWEQYRYAYCNECTMNPIEKTDVFSFLKCAIELTIKRREDIEKLCEY